MTKKILINLFLLVILISCSSDNDTVTPAVLSTSNVISSFKLIIDSKVYEGEINEVDKTIVFNLVGANIKSLIPTIEYSDKATISPAENIAQNFDKEVSYAVFAENGDSSIYRVIVNNRPLSLENKILEFSLNIDGEIIDAVINEELKEIEFDLKAEKLVGLTPSIVISKYASIMPEGDALQDFNNVVYYTVVAENGDEVKYKVIANRPKIENIRARYIASMAFYTDAELIVSGKFINPNIDNAKLYLSDGINKYSLSILSSESYDNQNKVIYNLFTKVPEGVPTFDNYKIIYESEAFNSESENSIDILAENIPIITSLDKEVYNIDDFVTITGVNLTNQLAIPNDGSIFLVDGDFTSIYSYEVNNERTEIKFQLIRQVYGWGGPVERTITLLGPGRRVGPTVVTRFGS